MNSKKAIINTVLSILITLCLAFNFDINTNSYTFNSLTGSGDVFWFVCVIFFIIVINHTTKIKSKRLWCVSVAIAFIISIFSIIGFSFTNYILSNIKISTRLGLFLIIKLLFNAIIYTLVLVNIYNFIDNYKIKENFNNRIIKLFEYNKRNMIILTIIIFLAYVPWFLNFFPGICSPDSTYQMGQIALEGLEFTNHHPVLHTLIISICLNIGNIFGNYNTGIAIYSMLQMIACAITFAYTVLYCGKKKVPLLIQIIVLLFFMFCPLIGSYSITMWKDIPFALCILITTILLIEASKNMEEFFSKRKNWILLIVFLLLDILFRKNGLYCVIFCAIFMIVTFFKKYKKHLSIVFIIPVIVSSIITGPIFNFLNIKDGDSKEALSVFMQQFAAVRKNHSNDLNKKEKKELDAFFISKEYIELYNPVFADPVKRIFSEKYLEDHKKEVITTYLKYAFKYPKTTIKAFISGSYGYYYPNLVGWEVYSKIDDCTYSRQMKLKQTPVINSRIINSLEYSLNSHNIAVLGVLTSCGFYFWLLIVVLGYLIYKKQMKYIASTALLIGIWGTALLSPVFCERRYVYALTLTVPLIFALCFRKNDKKIKI